MTRTTRLSASAATTEPAMAKLPPSNPPKLFIIPRAISRDATILTLAHPRSYKPTRYYFCPVSGIYEFLRIAAPKSALRSVLLAPEPEWTRESLEEPRNDPTRTGEKDENADSSSRNIEDGYVATAEFFATTKIDVLFLLLPMLSPPETTTKPTRALFQSPDDLFDQLSKSSKHFSILTNHAGTKDMLLQRLRDICDVVEAGDETMYRLNADQLLRELVLKAQRMVAMGLPQSMEQIFVQKALEPPVPLLLRNGSEGGADKLTTPSLEDGAGPKAILENTDQADSTISSLKRQPNLTSKSSLETSDTNISTSEATEFPSNADSMESREVLSMATALTTPDESIDAVAIKNLTTLLRLRTALSYLLSVYVPPFLATTLSTKLASPNSPIDFSSLDLHLSKLALLRAAVAEARSFGDFHRKRGYDDSTSEARLEKKKKLDEDEKRRKAGESRAVRDLKKVNVQGMKKMSDFFQAAAAAAKKT